MGYAAWPVAITAEPAETPCLPSGSVELRVPDRAGAGPTSCWTWLLEVGRWSTGLPACALVAAEAGSRARLVLGVRRQPAATLVTSVHVWTSLL